jgi:hypothetical protein
MNFRKVKLEGEWWTVCLINPNNPSDYYRVSQGFDLEQEADELVDNLNRIANERPNVVDDHIPMLNVKSKRSISLED